MQKGIIKKPYWGFKTGEIIYIDFSGNFHHAALEIYDGKKKFFLYVWDKEMFNECVGLC